MRTIVIGLIAIAVSALALAAPPSSFSAAKRIAEQEIYYDRDETFYCACAFDFEEGPALPSCGYDVRKQPDRANRIEWEHVVPAYDFGRQRQCWQDGGRRHCRTNDPVFRQAEADLHNLVPSIGEVNGDRSNMRYGMAVSSDAYQYGDCQAKVDYGVRAFEPPAHVRGDIARTYWYMRDTYGIRISRQQQQLFEAWARQDPVDAWERERNRRIAQVQGTGNRYVQGDSEPTFPPKGTTSPPDRPEQASSCTPRAGTGRSPSRRGD